MLHSPSSALRPLVTNIAIFIGLDAAVVVGVAVGDSGVATDAGRALVCTNVPTHIVTLIMRTLRVVVADNLTLGGGGVGGTVLGALVITRL